MARLGNLGGRLVLVRENGIIDIEQASGGRLPADPAQAFDRWAEVAAWLGSAPDSADEALPSDDAWLTPTPTPRQIIAIGINSRIKLGQFGLGEPTGLGFISKLRSALGDPFQPIVRWSERVFVETEVAIVIGKHAWQVSEADAPSHIAGLSVAEDLADIEAYVRIPTAGSRDDVVYHNPSKSRPGFAPIGPYLVTLDEVGDLDALRLTLSIDGRVVQDGSTADYLHSIPEIVSRLSQSVPLLPGDVILAGSPGQIEGSPLEPLKLGARIESTVVGLGSQRHVIVSPTESPLSAGQKGGLR